MFSCIVERGLVGVEILLDAGVSRRTVRATEVKGLPMKVPQTHIGPSLLSSMFSLGLPGLAEWLKQLLKPTSLRILAIQFLP